MNIHPAHSAALVGRERQLSDLRAAFKLVRAGQPAAVMVAGEAGIGKSRLAEEFAKEATVAGARVLTGNSVPLDGDGPAFAPLVSILRGLRAEFGADHLLDLAGPGADALAGLLPELGVTAADAAEGRGRLYEVVTSLFERVAVERPLVLVVEDLQWADGPTRDLLRFMIRSVRDAQLYLLATYRADEVNRGHPLRSLLAELDRLRYVHRIDVPRLSFDDVAVQVRELAGRDRPREEVERIYERSEGIPFFVEELAHIDDGCGCELTESLRDLLLVRVESLSEDTLRLLRLMSAAGNRVEHAVLDDVSSKNTRDLERALREAISAGVVVVDGDGYAFRHALLREALHDDMLPGENARMHARYAEALEERPGLMPGTPIAAEVAHHWYSARDAERAFWWSLRAADELERSYAHVTAQQVLERALELWDHVDDAEAAAGCDRIDLLARAANEANQAGGLERAMSLYKEALRLVDETAEPARAGTLLARWAAVLTRAGRPGAVDGLRSALELIPAGDEFAWRRAEALERLSGLLMLHWRFDEAHHAADETEHAARTAQLPHLVASAQITRGTVWAHHDDPEKAMAEVRRAWHATRDEPEYLLRYYINLSDMYYLVGRYAEAVDIATEGYERAKRLGRKRTIGPIMTGNAAEPMLAMGDWSKAERLIRRGLDLGAPVNHERHIRCLQGWLLLWRGDVTAAATLVDELTTSGRRRVIFPQDSRLVARFAADVAMAQDDPHRAWGEVAPVVHADDGEPSAPGYDLPLMLAGAQALGARLRGGDTGLDADIAQVRRRTAEMSRWWPDVRWHHLVNAELAGYGGDDPAAWSEALDVLRAAGGPVHQTLYAGYRLGLALITADRRDEAREVLCRAAADADELGAALYRGWIDDLSIRANLPLARGATTSEAPAFDVLTAREREVLRLIAEGRSNRDIGEALFISAKTASVHVSNILAKLGVANRGAAAAVAHRFGLVDSAAS